MAQRIPTVMDIEEFNYIPDSREKIKKLNVEARLKEIFKVFEREDSGRCDVREVGTIARAAGLNPSEADVTSMVEEIEDPESTGTVQLAKLQEVLVDIMMTHEFRNQIMYRDPEDTIMKAFELLDRDKKGYIEAEYLKEVMTNLGEKFNNEEILEMINASADPETGYIYYEDFAPVLATE